jgi:hypothetical protein
VKVGDLVATRADGKSAIVIKVNSFAYENGAPRVDLLSSNGKILVSISQLVLEVIK